MALKGLNTDINTLIRILISRAEIDINMIRDYYYKETKNNIKKDIQNKDKFKKNRNATNIIINQFK